MSTPPSGSSGCPDIATLIDDAILAVERDNPNLKNKLPRDYARRGIDPGKMAALSNLIAQIGFKGLRDKAGDTLGRAYECFLGEFSAAEGKLGGEFQRLGEKAVTSTIFTAA
jgi:type I restriction enzyme M protein